LYLVIESERCTGSAMLIDDTARARGAVVVDDDDLIR